MHVGLTATTDVADSTSSVHRSGGCKVRQRSCSWQVHAWRFLVTELDTLVIQEDTSSLTFEAALARGTAEFTPR